MRITRLLFPALLLCVALPLVAGEQDSQDSRTSNSLQSASSGPAPSFNQAVDRAIVREKATLQELRKYSPVVETYIQTLRPDPELGNVPEKDTYFLGRMEEMSNGDRRSRSFMPQPGRVHNVLEKMTQFYSLKFMPLGFMQMIVMDDTSFDRAHYDFKFVRREFLGDVRCLLIDVTPKKNAGKGRFLGRIWVEDQDFNIVRLNGTYSQAPRFAHYLHFDSWRLNMRPGLWLPAYTYSEESAVPNHLVKTMAFKSQTRLWGYDQAHIGHHDEFSTITVDSPRVKDESESAQDASPVQAQRAWNRMAEMNVLDRLEVAGLLAPAGEVDKVLETVVNNLEITNNLNVQPEVHARVLLTAPLESFTVGHTIVLSRGLIDVLPDEASLAAVLAHELAHITLGHEMDTKYAFSDRVMFPDEQTFRLLHMQRNEHDETEADTKAIALLRNSPYKDKLGNAGLFLEALKARQRDLPNLLQAHLGNSMELKSGLRMSELMNGAPELQARSLDQIAALPLGARVRLDPWSDKIEMTKNNRVPLVSVREKMPFEVTPVFPYITRFATEDKAKVAAASAPQQ
ncbi:MAG: M48 family metalloprotease [Acidobacteriia bacterium]|nr:M48 family metalloprotease [Terriglobia bacterium]